MTTPEPTPNLDIWAAGDSRRTIALVPAHTVEQELTGVVAEPFTTERTMYRPYKYGGQHVTTEQVLHIPDSETRVCHSAAPGWVAKALVLRRLNLDGAYSVATVYTGKVAATKQEALQALDLTIQECGKAEREASAERLEAMENAPGLPPPFKNAQGYGMD